MNIGITRNFLEIIRTLYKNTKSAVKVNDKVTDWFITEAGVRRGQNDSPTLFFMYINPLVKKIKSIYSKTQFIYPCIFRRYCVEIRKEESLQSMLNETPHLVSSGACSLT